jgi:DNA-binding transcriptional regulator YdaS (Cro superfamily)
MKLNEWVKNQRGRSSALARHLNLPLSFVSRMCTGDKPIPAEHALAIEEFTADEVTRQEMLPEVWPRYWKPGWLKPCGTVNNTAPQAHTTGG